MPDTETALPESRLCSYTKMYGTNLKIIQWAVSSRLRPAFWPHRTHYRTSPCFGTCPRTERRRIAPSVLLKNERRFFFLQCAIEHKIGCRLTFAQQVPVFVQRLNCLSIFLQVLSLNHTPPEKAFRAKVLIVWDTIFCSHSKWEVRTLQNRSLLCSPV